MPAFVKSTTAVNATTSLTQTIAPANTAGNLLVLTVGNRYATAVVTVTDTGGNTWLDATDHTTANGTSIWYVSNAVAAGTITITANVLSSWTVTALEFSGTNGGIDQHPAGNSGTSSVGVAFSTSLTGATAQASEVVVAILSINSTAGAWSAPTASYTTLASISGSNNSSVSAYQILSATGTQQYSGTYSKAATWYGNIATFKASGAAAGANPPSRTILQAVNRAAVI